jgi:hypothetical protein
MRVLMMVLIVLVVMVLFAGCWDRDRTLRQATGGASEATDSASRSARASDGGR